MGSRAVTARTLARLPGRGLSLAAAQHAPTFSPVYLTLLMFSVTAYGLNNVLIIIA